MPHKSDLITLAMTFVVIAMASYFLFSRELP